MKAIKILKKIYKNNPDIRSQRNNIDINFTIHNFNEINEAIKELEELENIKNTVIEEIEYAIAKPEYANVYLNNAIRFLRNK